MTIQRREGRALASPLRLLVSGVPDPETVDRAWAAVQAEFDEVDRAMSRFREDSEITELHRARDGGRRVSTRLRTALALADRAARLTGGRFDARVVIDLERLGSIGVPQAWAGAVRDGARRAHEIDGRGRSVRLVSPVDLGGVGKGLALRWGARHAAAILGPTGFLLEAGGDIVTRGSADGLPWSIALEDPSDDEGPIAACALATNTAIATSSTRRAVWRDPRGRGVHHLIDPGTGEPGGDGLLSVTVAAPDPAWAEIWSKALFLGGLDAIGPEARRRGFAAWWVTADGRLSMTPAARQQTTWVRSEAA